MEKNGLVLFNSTLISDNHLPAQTKVCKVAFTEIASSLGDVRVANMVALGKYLKEKNTFRRETVFEVFAEIAPAHKKHLIEINKKAIEKGYAA